MATKEKTEAELAGEEAARKLDEANKAAAEVAAANKAREEAALLAASGASSGYKVAVGLSITCRRGHLDQNTPVRAADFENGQKDIDDLLGRGALVKT